MDPKNYPLNPDPFSDSAPAPTTAGPTIAEARAKVIDELAENHLPHMDRDTIAKTFDLITATVILKLKDDANQAKHKAAASKETPAGVAVRIPKGARFQILGGDFIVAKAWPRGLELHTLPGTKNNPVALPKR